MDNNNGVRDWWARTAVGLGGLLTGMTLAWFTAFMGKGISRAEMENYVTKYSPYSIEKAALEEHQRIQDERISKLEVLIDNNHNGKK